MTPPAAHHRIGSLLIYVMLRPQPCSTLFPYTTLFRSVEGIRLGPGRGPRRRGDGVPRLGRPGDPGGAPLDPGALDRKSTRLNSSHRWTSYAVFCLKKK